MGAIRTNYNDARLIHRVVVKPHEESVALYLAPESWLAEHGAGIYTSYWEPIDITALEESTASQKPRYAPLCFFFADPQVAFAFKMRWG